MSFYKVGNSFQWFIARVVDINDEEKLGRVKIRIIHDQTGQYGRFISDDDLLWAWPISSIQSASLHYKKIKELEEFDTPDWIDAVGISPTGIAVGTYVFGFYLDSEEKNTPMIFGTYHKKSRYPEPGGSSMNQEIYPGERSELYNDVAGLARGIQTLPKEYIKGKNVIEPGSSYNAEYPHNTTYTTKSGHAIEIDDTPGAERIHIWHKSGSYEEIDHTGQRVRKTVGDDYEIVIKDKNVLIKGNANVEIAGNINIIINGNSNIEINGNSNIKCDKDMSITSTGKLSLNSNTSIKLTAPRIDLN
jgi:hypothetical protein